jgi:glutathionyl-hydroquinone reductase
MELSQRELYQHPQIKPTCNLDHIKRHYYMSQTQINPNRIVPLDPKIDFDDPHDREHVPV